jgi:hypothetical protein
MHLGRYPQACSASGLQTQRLQLTGRRGAFPHPFEIEQQWCLSRAIFQRRAAFLPAGVGQEQITVGVVEQPEGGIDRTAVVFVAGMRIWMALGSRWARSISR